MIVYYIYTDFDTLNTSFFYFFIYSIKFHFFLYYKYMLSIPIINQKWHTPIHGKCSKYIKIIISQIIAIVLSHEKVKNRHFSIEVKFCTTKEMTESNLEFNKTEKPCDIFSIIFNKHEENLQAQQPVVLGIIFLCPKIIEEDLEVINTQHKINRSYMHHLVHLIVHSTLHILGYDHQTEIERQSMEAKEILILSKLSITNPYAILNK